VQNQPQIAFDTDTNPLSEPAQVNDLPGFDARKRRHSSAQQKGTRDSDAFQRSALNSLPESFEINGDVRQFRH
jgi:hypothetical protein